VALKLEFIVLNSSILSPTVFDTWLFQTILSIQMTCQQQLTSDAYELSDVCVTPGAARRFIDSCKKFVSSHYADPCNVNQNKWGWSIWLLGIPILPATKFRLLSPESGRSDKRDNLE
jgi:hypothetical protein